MFCFLPHSCCFKLLWWENISFPVSPQRCRQRGILASESGVKMDSEMISQSCEVCVYMAGFRFCKREFKNLGHSRCRPSRTDKLFGQLKKFIHANTEFISFFFFSLFCAPETSSHFVLQVFCQCSLTRANLDISLFSFNATNPFCISTRL